MYSSEFYWKFQLGANFFHGYMAENCQKNVSLTFFDFSKNIFSGCTNKKSNLGFVIPTGLPLTFDGADFFKLFFGI